MHRSPLFLAALASLALAAPAAAAVNAGIAVREAWSRPAAAGSTGAGFLTLVNNGAAPVVLTGVESPLAAQVQIHQSRMARGVMSMARLDRLAAPPRGSVVLAPGGTHLMLIGLKAALKPGDRVPLVLRFADGATLKTELVVRAPN